MESRIKPPAIALIVAASISFLLNLAWLGVRVFGVSLVTLFGGVPSVTDVVTGTYGLLMSAISLGANGFVVYAALKMMNFEKHNIAVAGAVVAIIPCLQCCCLNVPAGIWALVILLLPDTKTAFSS